MKLSGKRLLFVHVAILAAAFHFTAVNSTEAPSAQRAAQRVQPVNIIFDTDMWTDIDDTLALAMIHSLQDRREVNLLAVTISSDDPWCAPYVDLVNTFYGREDIPIGTVRNGVDIAALKKLFPKAEERPSTRYAQVIAERKNPDGSQTYPHRLTNSTKTPEAVSLLRKVLAAQPDGSVVVVQVGYGTNLARLLDSKPDAASALNGHDLVKQKVRLLSVMGGSYAAVTFEGHTAPIGVPEFNLRVDIPSAQQLFAKWPTAVVASGLEIGFALLYSPASIERDYSYAQHHPVAETYRFYCEEQKKPKCPHAHPTWDLTSVLYAARPDRDYFSLSKPGTITVLDDGGTRFEESANGMHRYLSMNAEQKARTLQAMELLSSQPPRGR